MRRAFLYSLLAHGLVAGTFRGIVFIQENPLDVREASLEFSIDAVHNPRPRTQQKPGKILTDTPNAESSTESSNSGEDTTQGETFVPSGRSGRGPRWISGHITQADYPSEAEQAGLETIVRALVYIRRDGSVYDVRILRGHPAFNATVVRKLKAALFSPALDAQSGRPIAVKLILPIEFRLR